MCVEEISDNWQGGIRLGGIDEWQVIIKESIGRKDNLQMQRNLFHSVCNSSRATLCLIFPFLRIFSIQETQ